MATSGSFNTKAYDGRYLTFAWSQVSQDITDNTTKISWTLKGAGGDSTWYYTRNIKVTIEGETVYSFPQSKGKIQLGKGTLVASGEYTISHNADGSKSFTAYAEAGIYKYAVNCTGSGTFALDMIARASQPCVTWPEHTQDVGEFGDTISIHMNRNADTFTHTVRYAFGTLLGTIDTGVTTGTTWTIPPSFMDLLPANTSGSGTIYVDTYNGSTFIGTKWCGFTATVPESVKPTCSLTLEDITGVGDIYGSPVQGLSKIKITVNTNIAYSSPIASYDISVNGIKYTATPSTTGVLTASGDSPVTVTVKDKRGRSGSVSYIMKVQAYERPSVSTLIVHRCDEDGTTNDQGKWVQVTFSAAVSSMSNKNTANYVLRYKKTSEDTWTEKALTSLDKNYTVTNYSTVFEADEASPYDVEVTATDRHATTTRATSASTAFSLIDYHPGGNGLRFGGVAQEENTFQNDLKLHQVGNTYAFQPGAFNDEKGYTLLAMITLNTLNVNAPIVFEINRRGALCPMRVFVRFANSSTTTDPDLDSITYEGDNYGAFLYKSDASTWKLYVDNTSGWSNPCLQTWYTTDNQESRLSVSFPSEQVAELPAPWYRATPAKMQSILDFIYPVGSVYISYSHVSPASLFGGTWERIENAFLWGVDANGEIGVTGGEKEVTLSGSQIPSHAHQISVANTTSGTLEASNIIRYNSSKTSYNGNLLTGFTGGGEPHNNMPPYVQVSIWRRTA